MNPYDFTAHIRPHLLRLRPYSSARDEYKGTEGIFLDANENPLGSAANGPFNRYPDPMQWGIKTRLAALKGLRPEQIFLGNGSDEVIDQLFRAFCRPGIDNVILLPPTYGMYEVQADIHDVATRKVPLTADYQPDVEAILAACDPDTRLIWLCSPNNPTGNLLNADRIGQLLSQAPCLVVLDEAYADFAPEASWVSRLDQHPNLFIIQTFSKAWGLAGLRVGMGFGPAGLVSLLNKLKFPYNLNVESIRRVEEALDHAPRKDEFVQELLGNRLLLEQALKITGWLSRFFLQIPTSCWCVSRTPRGFFHT